MPFGTHKTLIEALRAYQVRETREQFIVPAEVVVSEYFRTELEYTLNETAADISEAAICENLISPVLREAIKPFAKVLGMWSHIPFYHGDIFLGVPDYIIGRRSTLSVRDLEVPYAMVMEAKRNDFDGGWGQCLAAMHAGQIVNREPPGVIYGIVSDGDIWKFGKLEGGTLTHHPEAYQLNRLDELFGALHCVLELCKQQVLSRADAA